MSLNRPYLAYIALLAGWLVFCYWLYAKEIYPRMHPAKGTPWPVFDEDLQVPLAFTWGSDIPHAGEGFENWLQEIKKIDSIENILVLHSYFFRDEAPSIAEGKQLARKRAERMIRYLELPADRIMIEIIPQDITADVKSHPFAALEFEELMKADILKSENDTLEICFPMKDSFKLTEFQNKALDHWLEKNSLKEETLIITGTADGTGIAESADVAWERAMLIKRRIAAQGWNEDLIMINTGQRNHSIPIRNRCVMVYTQ